MRVVWSLLVWTGCVEDVGEGKVEAIVAPAPGPETAPPSAPVPAALGKALPLDTAKSTIGALGAKITAKHPITFRDFTGELTVDGEQLTGVSVQVLMGTLVADVPKLTEHLRDADFFDVTHFPDATFKSTAVTAGGQGGTHTVTGTLTIRDTAKTLTFPATVQTSPTDVSARAEFVVDRKDFGIVYPGKADDLIQDNVVLTVQLFAPRSQ